MKKLCDHSASACEVLRGKCEVREACSGFAVRAQEGFFSWPVQIIVCLLKGSRTVF